MALVSALAYVLAVFSLAAIVVLLVLLFVWILKLRYLLRRRRKGRGKPLRKASLYTVTGMLIVSLILNAGAFGYSVHNIRVLVKEEEKVPAQDSEAPDKTAPDGSEPEETAPTAGRTYEPTGPAYSVEMLVSGYFHLSTIQNSKVLQLFDEISPDGMIAASDLDKCILNYYNYLERCATPLQFYDFYEGLTPLFPNGDVEEKFEDVFTYEESLAQIRGAGAALKRCRNSDDSEKLYNASHHLAIRAKDALFFGKKEGVLTVRMTWVLGELAFAALINELLYGELTGPDLSDWYYRTAQIFEYLGDIADVRELRLQLYYVAAVCYSCAYREISSCGLAQAGGSYGYDIWDAYFKMLYQVAIWTDPSLKNDFFVIILDGETDVEASDLSNAAIEQTQKKLEKLDSYQVWKESPEGIAAARELAERRERSIENG